MKGSKKGVFSEFLRSPSLGSGSVKGGQFSVTIGGHFSMTFDTEAAVRARFAETSRQIGLRGPSDRRGPRLHDLRHRFATRVLEGWYQQNQDPQRLLPVLSAMLGHVCIRDTYWYLESSPGLMSEAMQRMEHRWETTS